MSKPQQVRYGDAVYRRATFEEEADLLVTAAPKTQEEWKTFAQDIFAFYTRQLDDMGNLDEAAAALRGVADTIGDVDQQYQAAKQSLDVRDLRNAMSSAQQVRMRSLKQALPLLKAEFKKLRAVKGAKKAHAKIKKQVGKMAQSGGLKHWFK